ncbi:MAG: translation initiation factor IF-2 [Rubritalea sp.]|jgi:translation initiation factor IF-2|tara:strand:- start:7318 stop:9471 length:2154 start_codon:yes stop_codon:yes gene_type:complete
MADQKDNKKKKESLDLVSDKPKPSRRQRQREDATASKVKTVDDQKREALDIFAEDGKKKTSQVKKAAAGKKDIIPSISKLNDSKNAEFVTSKADSKTNSEDTDKSTEAPKSTSAEMSTGENGDEQIILLKPPIIVSDLAESMGLKPFQLMADLIKLEVFVAPNQAIEPDIAEQLCETHGFKSDREKREKGGGVHKLEEKFVEPEKEADEPEDMMKFRAPIITFMGHVDHGKTSLLDYVRKSRVAAGEAGGITQHIGAYAVTDSEGRPITFLDTPGHAIFSKMRARGADITDIVVLVVAADDGIMPQTKEAISHAKAAGKTIIVAINKCDKDGADPMKAMSQLMEHGLTPVDFGGDTECVQVSAVTGQGMDDLLELMALQAEVLELKANPSANARAVVIEASIQSGKGPTASVIVQNGTLKIGQPFICGPFAGKIKSMFDDHGQRVTEAGPAMPVEIIGYAELPHVGDEVVEMESERAAKKLSEERQTERRQTRLGGRKMSRMEDILAFAKDGNKKACLQLILKTDVQGSVGAIEGAIEEIVSEKVESKFLHAAAGAITESDVMLASSSNAVILGFNTKVEGKAVTAAKREGVQIKLYSIVYELIDTVTESMLGLLEPELRESVIGHALCKQVFKVNKGMAAGCIIQDGKVSRKAHARVLRGGIPVFDGKMSTLRRFNDEVEEVKVGIECGIRLGSFSDYEEDDIIECYNLEKVKQTL